MECAVIAILALLLLAPMLQGQTTDATVLGTVTDSSGAVVVGASVKVTNLATNISRVVQTDDFGNYEASALRPGNYSILIESKGFKTYERLSVSLDARATVRADAKLVIGEAQERVEVTAGAPTITTESGTVTEGLGTENILSLPVNLRAGDTSPIMLVATIPGVAIDNASGISVAGSHRSQNEVSVDGFSVRNISNSNSTNNSNTEMISSTETLSEVKVISELAPAEYGSVGDVTFVTHGGTNQYHGSLFEYFGNSDLNATPLFAVSKPPVRANDFGGSVGGPIRLPHYKGKDKTFFYFTYERNRQEGSAAIVEGVPTAAMRTGDFSSTGITLTDPFTGQPYPGNKLPSVNPVATNVLNTFYPMPNISGNLSDNYAAVLPSPVTTNLADVRIDQKLTEKQMVWGRFSWKDIANLSPLGLLEGDQHFTTHPRTVALNYTYTIRPNLLNEFRFGFSHESDNVIFAAFPNGQQLSTVTLGLNLPGPFPSGSAIPGFFFNMSGIAGTAGARQTSDIQNVLQFNDGLSWTHGRHSMKFGTDIFRHQFENAVVFDGSDAFGMFNFDGRYTGFDIADFELGLPYNSTIVTPGPPVTGIGHIFGFFAQDQFQVTKKLTINYGLRYEVHPPYFPPDLNLTNFDLTNGDVVVPNGGLPLVAPLFSQGVNACPGYAGFTTPCTPIVTASQDHLPQPLRFTQWKDFYPRFSFAYRVAPTLVVRGGFGMYNQTLTGATLWSMVGVANANVSVYPNSITSGVPAFQLPNTKTGGIGSLTTPGTEDFYVAESTHLKDPYAEQWSLSVEKQMGQNTGLRMTYTGMRSVNLTLEPNANQIEPQAAPFNPAESPYPNFNLILWEGNGGDALYQGVETVLTHRFTKGLSFQSSYVFSKNLSDAEGSASELCCGFVFEVGPFVADKWNPRYDYGDVNFTRRHRWLTTSLYEIPVGRGKRFGSDMPKVLNAIVGNWQTSGILLIQSGPYLTPAYAGGTDPSGTNANANGDAGQRPDRVCNGNISHPTAAGYFQTSCFVIPPSNIGRFGNAGVGILKGPGTVNLDAGLAKIFPITEKFRLRFEATAVNVLNHGNLGPPDLNIANTSDFGVIHSSQTVEGEGARSIQLGLRLQF
jgi:hypothetical protein